MDKGSKKDRFTLLLSLVSGPPRSACFLCLSSHCRFCRFVSMISACRNKPGTHRSVPVLIRLVPDDLAALVRGDVGNGELGNAMRVGTKTSKFNEEHTLMESHR